MVNKNIIEYKNLCAFHPGYYIEELVEEYGITQNEFALRMGTTPKTLSELINGIANLSNDLAKKLSVMTGTSVELWLNLQSSYDQKLIEISKEKDFDEQKEVLKQIDYSYFVNVAKLPKTNNSSEKIANLCKYFTISDLRILKKQDFLVNYRTSLNSTSEKNIINSQAWLQTAINFSKSVETKKYDENKLKNYLPTLRSMTIEETEKFLPKIKEILAECGVAFVLLPHLKNSGINGAVKWINEDRVVLAMNNRKLNAYIFWFSFFHEIKHVFQRKLKTTFISCTDTEMVERNKKLEEEADNFSANYLIRKEDLTKLSLTKYITDEEIKAFAKKIGIHPGIVAGRLQHEGILPMTRCAKLKTQYFIN